MKLGLSRTYCNAEVISQWWGLDLNAEVTSKVGLDLNAEVISQWWGVDLNAEVTSLRWGVDLNAEVTSLRWG